MAKRRKKGSKHRSAAQLANDRRLGAMAKAKHGHKKANPHKRRSSGKRKYRTNPAKRSRRVSKRAVMHVKSHPPANQQRGPVVAEGHKRRRRNSTRSLVSQGWKKAKGRTVTTETTYRKKGKKLTLSQRKFMRNPVGNWTNVAILSGGVALGMIAADMLDRFVATRTPKDGKHPWFEQDAVNRIGAKPDMMRAAAQVGLAVVSLGGAMLLQKRMPRSAYFLTGFGVGAFANWLKQVFVFGIAPKIWKVEKGNEMNFGNRLYSGEQDFPQKYLQAGITDQDANVASTPGQQDPLPDSYAWDTSLVAGHPGLGRKPHPSMQQASLGCNGGCGGYCGGNCGGGYSPWEDGAPAGMEPSQFYRAQYPDPGAAAGSPAPATQAFTPKYTDNPSPSGPSGEAFRPQVMDRAPRANLGEPAALPPAKDTSFLDAAMGLGSPARSSRREPSRAAFAFEV